MLIDTKSAFASKGVWGAVFAALGPALPWVLQKLGVADTVSAEQVAQAAGVVMTLGGAALAFVGRVFAKKRIA